MSKLLISGTTILAAGAISDDAAALYAAGQVFPKGVLGTYALIDAELPPGFLAAQCEYVDGAVRVKPIPVAAGTLNDLVLRIDADVDAIYALMLGNRAEEYNAAREQAAAFAAAGYAGTPPPPVQSWMDAQEWNARQAADDILAAAARLSMLRDRIRAQRLAHKQAARRAATAAQLDEVAGQWRAALAAIRATAGLA
jgi:hypothetical protein